MNYELNVVRIFVSDWAQAIRFYTETLGIPASFRDDEMGWAQLATGASQLALERVDPSDEEGRAYYLRRIRRRHGNPTRCHDHGGTRQGLRARASVQGSLRRRDERAWLRAVRDLPGCGGPRPA